jgi:hypothetical protein
VDTHGPLSRSPGGIAALELLSSKSGRWEAAIFLFACMCGWKNTSAVEFVWAPRSPEVYNIGGSRHSNCSILEAIEMCEQISGRKLRWSYEETNRIGDHIWWISDVRKFQQYYPAWKFRYGLRGILEEIHRAVVDRVERQQS